MYGHQGYGFGQLPKYWVDNSLTIAGGSGFDIDVMWNTIKFLGTIFISFIAMIGALGAENPFPLFAVAWGIWILYIVSLRTKRKKELDRERLIREILDKL